MEYKIIHETTYKFSTAVFLEPHYLRFLARSTPQQKVKSFELHVSPQAVGIRPQLDAENNEIHFCWFEGVHEELQIIASSVVEIKDFNPFNFILYPTDAFSIPFSYSDVLQKNLAACLQSMELAPSLIDYGRTILQETQSNTTQFITQLTQQIHRDFSVIYRELGAPLSPNLCFAQKQGSCRDLSWMQIHLLRHFGIASRYVSGYFYLDAEESSFELHAWLEVFLPGAGWVGFDPTHGMAAASAHIPLVASAHYEQTMPVSGTIRGDARARMENRLEIILEKQ